jgi:chloramphenicol O-acetyltransferase type A
MQVDTTHWPRRHTFEHFRGYSQPWFSVCVRVDVAPLKAALAARGQGGFALACHYAALRAVHGVSALRLRLQGGGVQLLNTVHAGTTVLMADDSFSFAVLPYDEDFARFEASGRAALAAARAGTGSAQPEPQALMHFTTLPWLHFTSFVHARDRDQGADIPKLAFGQLRAEGAQQWLPLSLDVHHALVDGLHVGAFVQAFEALVQTPQAWLKGANAAPTAPSSPNRPDSTAP